MNLFMKNQKKEKESPTYPDTAARGLISELCRQGVLDEQVEQYIALCHSTPTHSADESAKAKSKARSMFPNLAGFCRFLGTGLSDVSRLAADFPTDHDRLIAIFEDEALNSEVSPTLLSAYLKKRMRYTEDTGNARAESKEVSYCFDHDIFSDGQ